MIIYKKQLARLQEIFVEDDIKNLTAYISNKLPQAPVMEYPEADRVAFVGDHFLLGKKWGFNEVEEFRYLLYLVTKYNVTAVELKSNNRVHDILSFPDRSNDDKLSNLHYYLEYKDS